MGKTLQEVLEICIALGKFEPEHRIAKILDAAMIAVNEFSENTRGKLDEGLTATASGSSTMRPLIESSLELWYLALLYFIFN